MLGANTPFFLLSSSAQFEAMLHEVSNVMHEHNMNTKKQQQAESWKSSPKLTHQKKVDEEMRLLSGVFICNRPFTPLY